MRVRYFLVAAACAFCLLALQKPPAPEPQVAATQIDFDALHAEAKGALDALRQSSQRQAALDITAEF
jgi:hypothetical protein